MRAPVALAALAATLALAAGGCGDGDGNSSGSGEDAFSEVKTQLEAGEKRAQRVAAPRWETVTRKSGEEDSTVGFEIAEGAILWRVRWRCSGDGEFELRLDDRSLTRASCPAADERTSIATGPIELEVRTASSWDLTVEQQVETALHEPPLPEIASGEAELLTAGDFYPIENPGSGTASLYRLGTERLALRLERFRTAGNPGLFVWLSPEQGPRTTKRALASTHLEIGALKSTLGDQNYVLPRSISPAEVRSVIIWCKPIQVAYTAATLSG